MSLSYELTNDLIQKLKHLNSEFVTAWHKISQLSEAERNAIHKYARISNIGASTRIENALLTDSEVNWLDTILTKDAHQTALRKNLHLIENKLSKDRERSIEKVAGCRALLLLIYEKTAEFYPLTESDLRALHAELMRPYLKNNPQVGSYKIQPNSVIENNHISGETRIVFKTADAGPVTQAAMRDLIAWYNENIRTYLWPIAVIAEFVFRFLAIHPFQDGNGRLGRALFLLGLLQCDDEAIQKTAPFLALDRQIEKHKEEYYFVLNACSQGKFEQDASRYKIAYFLNFMIKMISKSFEDLEIYRRKYAVVNHLSASAAKIYDCFKEHPEIRLNTQIITKETKLPRRTVINALNILTEAELIQKYGQGAGTRYQITF